MGCPTRGALPTPPSATAGAAGSVEGEPRGGRGRAGGGVGQQNWSCSWHSPKPRPTRLPPVFLQQPPWILSVAPAPASSTCSSWDVGPRPGAPLRLGDPHTVSGTPSSELLGVNYSSPSLRALSARVEMLPAVTTSRIPESSPLAFSITSSALEAQLTVCFLSAEVCDRTLTGALDSWTPVSSPA